MPGVPQQETAHQALVRVCNEIDQSGAGGTLDDYAFIRAILQDVVVDAMFQTHESSNKPMEPADHHAGDAVNHLLDLLEKVPQPNEETDELFRILADQDMQGVLMAHDDIARKSFVEVQYPVQPEPVAMREDDSNLNMADGTRIIGVHRQPGEPLGITVGNEDGADELTVIRIAPGSATDKQGLLHVGDIIAEVNGVPVQTPDQLGDVIQRSGPDIKFKVLPPKHKTVAGYERFLRTHFNYNPHKDQRLSAPALGLSFNDGDILAIIKDNDKNWWDCKNLSSGQTGKIPSPSFEQRRRDMSQPPADKQKSSFLCGLGKKNKKKYTVNQPSKPDETPAVLYEDVIKVEPFRHGCLVLVGAQGLGRRSIKNRIIQMMPGEYGAPTPNTSRPMKEGEVDGKNYHFLRREEMEADIKSGKYLEYGELNRNYYGTSFSALREVMDTRKTCIVDPKSAAVAKLRTIDWMPFVVFVKPSNVDSLRRMNDQAINEGVDTARKSEDELKRIVEETQRISKQFVHLCDTTVTYDNFDSTCSKILQQLKEVNTNPQWVPASWESALTRMPVTE